jgi:hypothetical protein
MFWEAQAFEAIPRKSVAKGHWRLPQRALGMKKN